MRVNKRVNKEFINKSSVLLITLGVIFTIFFPSTILAIQMRYSSNFNLEFDFSQDPFTTSFGSDFRINGTAFGTYDLTFSLRGTNLESAKLIFKFGDIKFSLYNNIAFGTTNDPIVLYRISEGKNGIELESGTYKVVLFHNLELAYLAANMNNYSFILGKRGSIFDIAGVIIFPAPSINVSLEMVSQNFGNFDLKNAVLFVNLSEKNNNWGIRYTLAGASNTSLAYSTQVIKAQNNLSTWFKFGNSTLVNSYLNTHFNFDTIMNDFLGNTEAGVDISTGINTGTVYLNLKKNGFSNISGYMPNEWGEFLIKIGVNFSLFDFNTRLEYLFGKPVHTSVNTIGEIYYAELGRSFGNVSFFGKYQKIIGYYEEKDFFFSELKFTGFSNGEVALRVGNGDFSGNNPFRPKGGIYFSLWW